MPLGADRVPPLDLRVADRDHAIALFGNILVVYWKLDMTHAAVIQLRSIARGLAASPGPHAAIVVLGPQANPPGQAARQELDAMLRELSHETDCLAYVHEAEGFRGAAVRGVVTGLLLIVGAGSRGKVFSTVPQAMAWMSARLGGASGVLSAVHAVKAAVEAS